MPTPRALVAVARLAIAALLLGAATACGQGSTPGSGPTTAPVGGPSAVTAAPPASGMPGPSPLPDSGQLPIPTPTPAEPVAGQRQTATPWTLVKADGTTVIVQVVSGGPPCNAVTGADVAETLSTVAITTWTGPIEGAKASDCAGPQPAIAAIQWIRVTLKAPVGTRALVPGHQP
ncbi:MAG: hypothetical protein KBF43_06540 [Dermatophilaceae bacterium]|nr:hypothetical protein [Actinomycetales bacterium]MBP8882720.1 hypothetical protein [Dermatophilaceae bacterium]MBP9918229.1 hypothetical protein [Dermatophilaceae bacterium]